MSPARKRFAVASGLPPSADEVSAATTPRRQDVPVQAGQGRPQERRTAFTWRLTLDQAQSLDEITLRLKRQLGRGKLDRAEILAAVVTLIAGNPAVFGALAAQMQDEQTS